MHGMYATLDAELEVQRTTRRAELTAFVYLLRVIIGPTTAHVDNTGKGWTVEGKNEQSQRGQGRNLKLEVSWHKEYCGKLPIRGCWKTGKLPKEDGDQI